MADQISRRSALKKIGVAGGVAWAAPVIHGAVTSAAHAFYCPPSQQILGFGDSQRWNSNCGGQGRWNGQARTYSITLPGCGSYTFIMDVGAPGTPGQGQADIVDPDFTVYLNGVPIADTANDEFTIPGCAGWRCQVVPVPQCIGGVPTPQGGCPPADCNGSKLDAYIQCCPV